MSEPRSRRLAGWLLLWYLIAAAVLVAATALSIGPPLRAIVEERTVGELSAVARVVATGLPPSPESGTDGSGLDGPGLSELVEEQAVAAGVEVAVIDATGAVLAVAPRVAGDRQYGEAAEVAAARAGSAAHRVRSSGGEQRLFVAVPPDAAGRVVDVSVGEERIVSEVAEIRSVVVLVVLGLAGLGLVVVALAAGRVAVPIRELAQTADRVADGHLDVPARRSRVAEIDRLGVAIGGIASELGRRIRSVDEERRTLETVLGALSQGIVLIAPDDRVLYSNPAAAAILGPIPDRAALLVPRGTNRSVREARVASAPVRVESDHGAPPRRLVSVATPLQDDGGVMLVVEDATDRLRIEAMRREFVADASHELKTPVAAIIASSEALELALDRDLDRARGFARGVEASARHLSRMIEDLLDLSRLEASELPDDPVALHDLVEQEARDLASRAGRVGVDLSWDLVPATVRGSVADLRLAVRNLVDNAIRYNDPGGTVRLEMTVASGKVRLAVSDTGAGIPTRALGRVFERFFRVDEARSRATGGTGLGLAIVKHVCDRHGGTVSVESQLGAGSTFTIALPLLSGDPEPPPTQG